MPDKHPLEEWWQQKADRSLLNRMASLDCPPPVVVQAWNAAIDAIMEERHSIDTYFGDYQAFEALRYKK